MRSRKKKKVGGGGKVCKRRWSREKEVGEGDEKEEVEWEGREAYKEGE